jgi:dTDP-4-amino-4,6-dideoxygalactose transaminase
MISYGRQSINKTDIDAVVNALKGDMLTTGPLVEQFEFELEKLVGAPCITVSSGTAALHCAYAAIGLETGDEVITPPLTFIATQATAIMFGASIVFADILSDTGNIDPKAVEAAITSRTKAIVAVDYAGHPADLEELRRIADKYKIYLIEDAAHSIGSTYKTIPVGSIADLTTFSFFPTKNMTTAEGGAVASRNNDLLEKAKRFSRQGLVRKKSEFIIKDQGPWHQEVQVFGLNYRLPDVLCALGISQVARIQEFKEKRASVFETYTSLFGDNEKLVLPTVRDEVSPMWHLYPLRVPATQRLRIFKQLRENGIGVQVNYMPAYWHPAFKFAKYERGQFPESDAYYQSEISLPMFSDLASDELELIANLVLEFID